VFQNIRTLSKRPTVSKLLRKHFRGYPPDALATTSRTFPITSRVDLQLALDEFFTRKDGNRRFGLNQHEVGIAQILNMKIGKIVQLLHGVNLNIAPLQYDDVDVGEGIARFPEV
jgi:hypothetical protein